MVLYPAGHPAIAATLGRVVYITSAQMLPEPLRLTVTPDALLLGDRGLAKPDAAASELASILHAHLIGELTVHPGGDAEAWHAFLVLIGRTPESVREDGGILHVWTNGAPRHIDLREIDYAEVLRERAGGEKAAWDRIVASCLHGDALDLDDDAVRELLAIAGDPDRISDLMTAVENAAGSGGAGPKTAALLHVLRAIVEAVTRGQPAPLEPVLENMATAVGRLSPDMLLAVVRHRNAPDEGGEVVDAVVNHISDPTIGRFVARNVGADGTATDRLALAFQALVRDANHQDRLLAIARDEVAASPLGSTEGFESAWNHIAEKLLTSYSDEQYVSGDYGRELSGARAQAIDVDQSSDDPPERIGAWLSTVATSAVRTLDLTLLRDLLRIEEDPERWSELMGPVVHLLEDLLLVGDFEAARELIAALVGEAASTDGAARRNHARGAIDRLIAGPMVRHLATHLATIDEAQFDAVKTICLSLGEPLVKPLVEALATEERTRPRERLTAILVGFGAGGRRTIERLKSSQNAGIRRTAILLIRELGGSEALPELAELLDESQPQTQRDAVRAILNIGTSDAYRILERALATGSPRTRDAIMHSVGAVRDGRATPLFMYLLRHVDHRGPMGPVYVRAIEALGALRDPSAIGALKDVLYRGDWWAPRRTAALRSAAAGALKRIGTPDALDVLEQAAACGYRRIRAVARTHLPAGHERRQPSGRRSA